VVYSYSSDDPELCVSRNIDEKNKSLKFNIGVMNPATIGLLISIAPTVLDLLFGRGHHIKDQALIQNLKTMYGYGLEGYGYAERVFDTLLFKNNMNVPSQ
jgi:peptidoglycan biosynthesis protein MviN/MurJ (putative lipid II flippase)